MHAVEERELWPNQLLWRTDAEVDNQRKIDMACTLEREDS